MAALQLSGLSSHLHKASYAELPRVWQTRNHRGRSHPARSGNVVRPVCRPGPRFSACSDGPLDLRFDITQGEPRGRSGHAASVGTRSWRLRTLWRRAVRPKVGRNSSPGGPADLFGQAAIWPMRSPSRTRAPSHRQRGARHPENVIPRRASFRPLRIAVNKELEQLEPRSAACCTSVHSPVASWPSSVFIHWKTGLVKQAFEFEPMATPQPKPINSLHRPNNASTPGPARRGCGRRKKIPAPPKST